MTVDKYFRIDRRKFLASSAALAAVPPAVMAANPVGGFDYDLELRTAEASLFSDPTLKTPVWAYNGTVPGPVLRARKGQELSVRVTNFLEQPTSVHWHGLRIDNAMDGVSNLTPTPIRPGEVFEYRFTPPDAGTFWYHPHNRTWEQLARGLYGPLIVEDATESLPVDRDYTIMVDDWWLTDLGPIEEGSIGSMHDWSHGGRLGNVLTLNGRDLETLPVILGERVRLRFINYANAGIMRFGIRGHQPWLIALDGQLIEPVRVGEEGVEIAPAQQFDLVVDVNGKSGEKIEILETSGSDYLVAGYLVCGEASSAVNKLDKPIREATQVVMPDLASANSHELVMSGGAMRFLSAGKFKGEELNGRTLARMHKQFWAFNGSARMEADPLFSAKVGETIRLRMVNETLWPHAIHLHGHHFMIAGRGTSEILSCVRSRAWNEQPCATRCCWSGKRWLILLFTQIIRESGCCTATCWNTRRAVWERGLKSFERQMN